jgi:hypothetical protein
MAIRGRLRARLLPAQQTEVAIGCIVLNRMLDAQTLSTAKTNIKHQLRPLTISAAFLHQRRAETNCSNYINKPIQPLNDGFVSFCLAIC